MRTPYKGTHYDRTPYESTPYERTPYTPFKPTSSPMIMSARLRRISFSISFQVLLSYLRIQKSSTLFPEEILLCNSCSYYSSVAVLTLYLVCSSLLLLLLPLALLQRTTQYGSLAFYNFLLIPADATATNTSFDYNTKWSHLLHWNCSKYVHS